MPNNRQPIAADVSEGAVRMLLDVMASCAASGRLP
jgi:hypothetical protein